MRSNLPYLSDEHARAIAHVAIRSAALDHMIEILLTEAYFPNQRSAKTLTRQPQAKQIEAIQDILIDRFPWYKEDVEAFIIDVKAARKERNKIIHHIWGETDETGAATLASYRPFRDSEETSMTAEQVWKISDNLLDYGTTIVHVIGWLQKLRPPLPGILSHTLQQGNYPWPLARGQKEQPQGLLSPLEPDEMSDQ